MYFLTTQATVNDILQAAANFKDIEKQ